MSRSRTLPLGFTPYRHQRTAFSRLAANAGRSTVVATGTGSGKTECFLYPILDHCRERAGTPGIKAIVIYPMNALAADQARRIEETIDRTPALRGKVTAGVFVGRDNQPQRSAHKAMGRDHVITDRGTLREHPPDILLTNYKMLDYLLVRPFDFRLWRYNQPDTLRYLVVDELHTFDGAQGTDLACLIRRLRVRLGVASEKLIALQRRPQGRCAEVVVPGMGRESPHACRSARRDARRNGSPPGTAAGTRGRRLMTQPEKLLSVFEKARDALKSCVCNQDPLNDGCYRCVFAYRRSREMAETSRDTAIEMLDRILARKDELEEVPSLGGLTINATFDSELEARFVEALRRVEIDGARAVAVRADLVRGKPGYVLKVGNHTCYMETQAELGASDGVVEPSRPDFLIRPARPAAGQPPVAVFTDGFEFHRDTTDGDSLKRMALVRAGFLVWSLTWHDLEFVFGKAADVPDLLAGAKAGDDMARLQRELDRRWDIAGLRPRLAEPTLKLLVNYLRAPEPSRWKQAVFTELFDLFDRQRMLSAALRASFDRATAEALPDQAREALGDLPPPVAMAGIGAWHGTASAFFDLFAAFPLAAVQQGDPDAAAVVVYLHDDKASRESNGYRRVWNGVLRLFTLLQFLPGTWWTTRVGVQGSIYPEFAPAPASPGETEPTSGPSAEEWKDVIGLADREVHGLLGELSARGAPVPEVGFELLNPRGAVLAEAELGWPAHEVAMLLPIQETQRDTFERAGWQVFMPGSGDLADAVANALAGDNRD